MPKGNPVDKAKAAGIFGALEAMSRIFGLSTHDETGCTTASAYAWAVGETCMSEADFQDCLIDRMQRLRIRAIRRCDR